jgi:hypothetical protein
VCYDVRVIEGQVPPEEIEARVERWLAEFPRVPREVILERIASLEEQLERWQQALAVHDTLYGRNGTPKSPSHPATPHATPPSKPAAVLSIMATEPDRAWKLSEVRDVMVSRGWLPAGERGTHHIQSVAYKLKNRKHIQPVNTGKGAGYYRLSPAGLRASQE